MGAVIPEARARTCSWLHLADSSVTRTVRLSVAHGAATVSPPAYRATRFVQVRRAGRRIDRLRPDTAQAIASPAELPVQEWLLALSSGMATNTAATVTLTAHRRSYLDSAGINFLDIGLWCDLHVWTYTNTGCLEVTDGTRDPTEVPAMLASMAAELRQRRDAAQLPPPSAGYLILAPTVAAVLLHELVGHGAEEVPLARCPLRVGPSDLFVTAHSPRIAGYDDEGVPTQHRPLVVSGVLAGPVLDVEQAENVGQAPAGLAQAAMHQGPPLARCTHLYVGPGTLTRSTLTEITDGVWCTATSGAELVHRHAVVTVSASVRLRNGEPADHLQPFLFIIGFDELADRLVGIGSDVTRTRSGRCVKKSQAVPTQARAPTIALEGVTVHPR